MIMAASLLDNCFYSSTSEHELQTIAAPDGAWHRHCSVIMKVRILLLKMAVPYLVGCVNRKGRKQHLSMFLWGYHRAICIFMILPNQITSRETDTIHRRHGLAIVKSQPQFGAVKGLNSFIYKNVLSQGK